MQSKRLRNKYDLVTCFEVLEHVEKWKTLVKRIAKSSNKYLLFSFPTGKMRNFEEGVGHLRNFRKGEIEKFLESLGHKPIKVYYVGFPFYSPIFRDLCDILNAENSGITIGKYGIINKILSQFFYFLFKFLSTKNKRGDQFCGLFIKK